MFFGTRKGLGTTAVTTMIMGALFGAATAQAGVIAPELTFSLQVNENEPIYFFPVGQQTGENTWVWNGSYSGNGWSMPQCSIFGDTDPIVSSNITFVNNTLATQTYTITVTLPVSPVAPSSLMDGSMGGSVTDANGVGGATVAAVAGSSIYQAQIDGTTVATLLDFPYSASPINSGGTAAIGPASFGQPVPIPGPAVASTIGIILQFTLTAGDSVAMTSFFRVEPIPAPAGLALLGLAGLIGSRRRR